MSNEFDRVRDLLVKATGVRAAKVTPDARLVEDLGIDGDDLAEFMDTYFATLSVEAGDYDPAAYVPDEGLSLFGRSKPKRPISVSMLVDGLRFGRWPHKSA